MELIFEQTKQTFAPKCVTDFAEIVKVKKTFENDVFEKYEAIAQVKGELIVCNDISKLKTYSKCIVKQTYEEYLQVLSQRDAGKDQWIYNIIDGTSETDKILFRDEQCIVVPTYVWNGTAIDKLHILCLPTNKELRTIRELNAESIPLLQHMKNVTIKTIADKYGINEGNLKMFFHYDPSTYHLHIHFVNTAHIYTCSSVEYSHDLDSVIFNLQLDGDYYKKINLNVRI